MQTTGVNFGETFLNVQETQSQEGPASPWGAWKLPQVEAVLGNSQANYRNCMKKH